MKNNILSAFSLILLCAATQAMHYNRIPSFERIAAQERAKELILATAQTYYATFWRHEARRQEILKTDPQSGQTHYFTQEQENAKKAFFEKIGIAHNSMQLINAPYYDYNPAQQTPEQWHAKLLQHPLDLKDIAKTLGLEKKHLKELPTNNCTIV